MLKFSHFSQSWTGHLFKYASTTNTSASRCSGAWTDLLCYPCDFSSREVSLYPGSWACRQFFSTGGRLKHSQKWARETGKWKNYKNKNNKNNEKIDTRTQQLQSRKENVEQFICNQVQVRLLSAFKLTSFIQFRYAYVSESGVLPYS